MIRLWLDREGVAAALRTQLQVQLDLFESGGPEVLPGLVANLDEGFHVLRVRRKGLPEITPIFCYGPFGETEITILAGAPIEGGLLKARDILPIARNNLELLRADRMRRKRERLA